MSSQGDQEELEAMQAKAKEEQEARDNQAKAQLAEILGQTRQTAFASGALGMEQRRKSSMAILSLQKILERAEVQQDSPLYKFGALQTTYFTAVFDRDSSDNRIKLNMHLADGTTRPVTKFDYPAGLISKNEMISGDGSCGNTGCLSSSISWDPVAFSGYVFSLLNDIITPNELQFAVLREACKTMASVAETTSIFMRKICMAMQTLTDQEEQVGCNWCIDQNGHPRIRIKYHYAKKARGKQQGRPVLDGVLRMTEFMPSYDDFRAEWDDVRLSKHEYQSPSILVKTIPASTGKPGEVEYMAEKAADWGAQYSSNADCVGLWLGSLSIMETKVEGTYYLMARFKACVPVTFPRHEDGDSIAPRDWRMMPFIGKKQNAPIYEEMDNAALRGFVEKVVKASAKAAYASGQNYQAQLESVRATTKAVSYTEVLAITAGDSTAASPSRKKHSSSKKSKKSSKKRKAAAAATEDADESDHASKRSMLDSDHEDGMLVDEVN